MYVRVYSPDGEMFEVTRDRADQLILEQGWTQTPQVSSTAAPAETTAPKVADKTHAHVFGKPCTVEDDGTDETEPAPEKRKTRSYGKPAKADAED